MKNKIVSNIILEYLNEGVSDVKELNDLASEIINHFAEKNYPLVNRFAKVGFDNIKLLVDSCNVGEIILEKDYSKLNTLIELGLTVNFKNNINSHFYEPPLSINLMYPSFFIEDLEEVIDSSSSFKNSEGEFSVKDSMTIIRGSLKLTYNSTLVHELQHALDYIKSNGKYANDKKSNDYHNKYTKTPYDIDSKMSDEQKLAYLDLPHEYWARLSEYFGSNFYSIKNKDFKKVYSDFIKSDIIQFDKITSEKDRRKLLKAIYKIWDNNKKDKGM